MNYTYYIVLFLCSLPLTESLVLHQIKWMPTLQQKNISGLYETTTLYLLYLSLPLLPTAYCISSSSPNKWKPILQKITFLGAQVGARARLDPTFPQHDSIAAKPA